MSVISRNFYTRPDVVRIARELLGKYLITKKDGQITSGIICETEAYAGVFDKASHAFGGRRTRRTEIMYKTGGTAYIYICYGIHSLFNIVTNQKDIPDAVLIRGIKPSEGLDIMYRRSGTKEVNNDFGIGPGKVSKILGIHYSQTGYDLTRKPKSKNESGIWLEDRGIKINPENIISGPRIGVQYAGKDALLPYRFQIFL
jgi:DNA-3-methyladenine glycosylase